MCVSNPHLFSPAILRGVLVDWLLSNVDISSRNKGAGVCMHYHVAATLAIDDIINGSKQV